MKNIKGAVCTMNSYVVSGIAMVDGKPVSFEDAAETRDARADKARYAAQLGTKASNVLLDYTLNKRKFIINSVDYTAIVNALAGAGISVTECE